MKRLRVTNVAVLLLRPDLENSRAQAQTCRVQSKEGTENGTSKQLVISFARVSNSLESTASLSGGRPLPPNQSHCSCEPRGTVWSHNRPEGATGGTQQLLWVCIHKHIHSLHQCTLSQQHNTHTHRQTASVCQ